MLKNNALLKFCVGPLLSFFSTFYFIPFLILKVKINCILKSYFSIWQLVLKPPPSSIVFISICIQFGENQCYLLQEVIYIRAMNYVKDKLRQSIQECLSRPYYFKFFKGCLPQILLGPFLNILSQLQVTGVHI